MTEETLFARALELPVDERAAFLERECPDPALRARVHALLAADARSHAPIDVTTDFTPQPADEAASTVTAARSDEAASTVIAGKYTLVDPIGEGGMGSVWRAKQTEPVKRFVAVKLIKAGMDSKQVLARFEAERQALALMDHPNIAKVLDGGLHDYRPFFVMELVKGTPITKYCDHNKLTPQQRLELFVQVCQAIQHAHQKGIIHRDIKPSNVLIALYDDKPVVKVIDFGVAKATGGALTEATIDTGMGGVVGTPQYMSPEQATLNNVDIDTRSDVYALGVLLYELLAGSPPFSDVELKKRGLLEILRVVREEEPPRPSTKLSTADALPSISANRGVEPSKLTGLLRNELDWIVMKALEKDRARRYETANGFAADIQRYLAGEPVTAYPPSAAYRVKKFVRRNKGKVIAASLVLLTLLAGVAGTTYGLIQARKQERIAKQQERLAVTAAAEERQAKEREAARAEGEKQAKLEADAKRQEAERNLGFARKGNEILGSVFTGLNPRAEYHTVAELRDALKANLNKAVQELEGDAIGDPVEVAAMQNTLGLSLLGLGEPTQASTLFEKARATLAAKLGPDHSDTLTSMSLLALGYHDAGKFDLAVPLHEEAFKRTKAKLGPDHPQTLTSMNNLAAGYTAAGKRDLALPLLEETFKLQKAKLGADHPDTLVTMNNLAGAYQDTGNLDQALPLYEETLKLQKAKLGPDHPDTLMTRSNLAGAYHQAGKLDLAMPLFEETLKLRKAKLGPDHPDTLASMSNLAVCCWSLKRLDKSVPMFEELLSLREKKLGRGHPETLATAADLGVNYKDVGRIAEALPLLEEAYHASAKFPNLRAFGAPLLDAYAKAGKGTEAAKLIEELLADARKSLPKDSPQLAGRLAQFSQILLEQKLFTAAEPLLRECLAIREKTQPDAWSTFNTMSALGGALLGQKKYADAEPLLLKGYEGMKAREETIPKGAESRIPEALDRLIELYTATNKPDELKKYQDLRAQYPAAQENP